MFLISGAYCSSHHLSNEQFLELDRQHQILNYIAECPGVFDLMTEDEMVQEIDAYLQKAYEAESTSGVDALYDFIRPEP